MKIRLAVIVLNLLLLSHISLAASVTCSPVKGLMYADKKTPHMFNKGELDGNTQKMYVMHWGSDCTTTPVAFAKGEAFNSFILKEILLAKEIKLVSGPTTLSNGSVRNIYRITTTTNPDEIAAYTLESLVTITSNDEGQWNIQSNSETIIPTKGVGAKYLKQMDFAIFMTQNKETLAVHFENLARVENPNSIAFKLAMLVTGGNDEARRKFMEKILVAMNSLTTGSDSNLEP